MLNKMICGSILFILFGCVSYGSDVKFSNLTRDFFRNNTTDEQERLFTKYSLDEKYELFIFGNQVVHPPATYLAYSFAKQGPIIVPFLKSKLKATQDEVTIRDIVLIFSKLAQLRLYDFPKDTELMDLLDKRVNDMHGIWKETTREMISTIHSMH